MRALIAYGANPDVDLVHQNVLLYGQGYATGENGPESILVYAARSGNPELVCELLRYKPDPNARDTNGRTAVIAALAEDRDTDRPDARVQIVRMLAVAGANVNAKDRAGNTALHETGDPKAAETLLKLGTNVNARNRDGETPVFTTVNAACIPLFARYGADLSIRNKAGETALEAAQHKSAEIRAALAEAMRTAQLKHG